MLLPTTLLFHQAPAGPHFDWLIVPPAEHGEPDGRLWTARVAVHWRDWAELGAFDLTAMPPHRRRYLTWQGPLTDGRGFVYTAGRGHVVPHLWTPRRIELTLHPVEKHEGHSLALTLARGGDETRWRAAVRR